jgi:hypothetical protein
VLVIAQSTFMRGERAHTKARLTLIKVARSI